MYHQLTKLSPWTWFSYFMIAAAPTLGSITTALGGVASLIAIGHLFQHRRRYTLSPVTKYLVLVLAFYSYTLLLAGVRGGVDLAFFKSIPVYSQFLYFIPLAIVLPHKAREITLSGISRAAMAGVAIASVGAIIENVYITNARVELLSGNPLIFASTLVTLSFLCLAQLKQKSVWERCLATGLFLAGILTVAILAKALGPVIACILFCFPAGALIALYFKWWRTSRIIGIPAVIIFFSMAFVWVSMVYMPTAQRTVVSEPVQGQGIDGNTSSAFGMFIIDTKNSSWYARAVMYRAGIRTFTQQPILGYGPQNRFSAAIPYIQQELEGARISTEDKVSKQRLQKYKSLRFSHLHNIFITHAVAAGLMGVIAVLLILTAPLVLLTWVGDRIKCLEHLYVAATLSVLVMLLGMTNLIFFHDLHNSFTLFNIIVFHALISKAMQSQHDMAETAPRPPAKC